MRRLLLAGSVLVWFAPLAAWADQPITMLFAGDVMLSRSVDTLTQRAGTPNHPWQLVADETRAADLFFINLEAPLAPTGPYDRDGLVFRVRPSALTGLTYAGVDVASLANNHIRDAGADNVQYTQARLDEAGIGWVLPGHPSYVTKRGVRIGFAGSSYTMGLDASQLKRDVRWLKRRRADLVVVTMHAGREYVTEPTQQQRSFAQAAVRAGADLVVGHHPHVPQTVERYRGRTIVYSLGNFIFDQFWSQATMRGQVLELRRSSSGRLSFHLRDITINRQAQPAFD